MHGPNGMTSHSPRLIYLLLPNTQPAKVLTWYKVLDKAPTPEISQAPHWLHQTPSTLEEAVIQNYCNWYSHTVWFPCQPCLCQHHHSRAYRILNMLSWESHTISLQIKGLILQRSIRNNSVHGQGIHYSYHKVYHLEVVSLLEQWNY